MNEISKRAPAEHTTAEHGRNATIDEALAEAKHDYAARNPASAERQRAAESAMPGGNTRTVLHYDPFPLGFARGEGARLLDVDGHAYVDLLGEYTAGIAGHSHPAIRRAVLAALDGGISLGGHNTLEPRFSALVKARFPAMEKLRFTNSGTEANLLAISTAVAASGKQGVMVFRGGYHGAVFTFSGGANINAPFDYVLAGYNDLAGTRALLAEHADELAAVILEPMLGGGGCIPATPEFLMMLREETAARGITLIFDEVMTSRLAPHGLGHARGITPDLMTLGKYVGGGMSFGAFGGTEALMSRFDPAREGALPHAGTFNNNVLTMSAGTAALTEIYTEDAAIALNLGGEKLRARLNDAAKRSGAAVQWTGIGSMMAFHPIAGDITTPEQANAGDGKIRELLFFDLLRAGFWIARRGMIALSLPLTAADHDAFVAAFEEFLSVRRPLLG
jgi:glutamate-1-semialdehyde 2,1-aminomutase